MNQAILLIFLTFVVLIQTESTYLVVNRGDEEHSMKVSLANFGYFKYGHNLTGRLQIGANFTYWGDGVDQDRFDSSDAKLQKKVDFDVFTNNIDGCKTYQEFNEKYIENYGQPIYVVNRGQCTFVQKASNAAKQGKMLIIINNSDEPDDIDNINLGNDQSGEHITILVVLISYNDGEKLKTLLNKELHERDNDKSLQVWISITFNNPHQSEKSVIQYWMIPSQKENYVFLSYHTAFLQNLIDKGKVSFEPHFVFFRCGDQCKKNYENKKEVMDNFCIQDGLYCHPDPDNKGKLTGVNSIIQAVNEMCIYDKFPQYFLYYLLGFHDCFVVNNNPFLECHQKAVTIVEQKNPQARNESFNILVIECVINELFPLTGKSILLEKEYKLFTEHVKFYPALFVNGDLFKRNLKQIYFIAFWIYSKKYFLSNITNQGDLQLKEGVEGFICESFEDKKDVSECD